MIFDPCLYFSLTSKQEFGSIAQVSMMRGMDLHHADGRANVSPELTSLAATSIFLCIY